MKYFLTAIAFLFFTQAAAAEETDIQAVISDQVEAFQSDDFERAFSFASPTIRQIFGSPEQFGRMVSTGYPMVWRPAKVEFLELRNANGRLTQTVLFTDQTGALHVLAYDMQQREGVWEINGVQIIKAPEVGA